MFPFEQQGVTKQNDDQKNVTILMEVKCNVFEQNLKD